MQRDICRSIRRRDDGIIERTSTLRQKKSFIVALSSLLIVAQTQVRLKPNSNFVHV